MVSEMAEFRSEITLDCLAPASVKSDSRGSFFHSSCESCQISSSRLGMPFVVLVVQAGYGKIKPVESSGLCLPCCVSLWWLLVDHQSQSFPLETMSSSKSWLIISWSCWMYLVDQFCLCYWSVDCIPAWPCWCTYSGLGEQIRY